jgi:hypothetical protein
MAPGKGADNQVERGHRPEERPPSPPSDDDNGEDDEEAEQHHDEGEGIRYLADTSRNDRNVHAGHRRPTV